MEEGEEEESVSRIGLWSPQKNLKEKNRRMQFHHKFTILIKSKKRSYNLSRKTVFENI